MAEPFIAQIMMFGGNFAPRGWALCNGQILSIAQNTALFSILGTTYGGDGVTTFALPNLQSRVPMHWGQGPGLTARSLGEMSGTETTTLIASQLPPHVHQIKPNVSASDGVDSSPENNYPAVVRVNVNGTFYTALAYGPPAEAVGNISNTTVAGGNQPFSIIQPYLCVTFIIALQGIFPSRN